MKASRGNKNEPQSGVQSSIYVVDDEAMLLELASIILEPLGREIRTFRDPEAALEAFTASQPRPAVLITDYAMHNMNGMALLEACRRIEPGQKVLLVSGTVGPEIFQNAPIRPDSFLAKPYHARELLDLVQSMLTE